MYAQIFFARKPGFPGGLRFGGVRGKFAWVCVHRTGMFSAGVQKSSNFGNVSRGLTKIFVSQTQLRQGLSAEDSPKISPFCAFDILHLLTCIIDVPSYMRE
jgi:hypothetical protein